MGVGAVSEAGAAVYELPDETDWVVSQITQFDENEESLSTPASKYSAIEEPDFDVAGGVFADAKRFLDKGLAAAESIATDRSASFTARDTAALASGVIGLTEGTLDLAHNAVRLGTSAVQTLLDPSSAVDLLGEVPTKIKGVASRAWDITANIADNPSEAIEAIPSAGAVYLAATKAGSELLSSNIGRLSQTLVADWLDPSSFTRKWSTFGQTLSKIDFPEAERASIAGDIGEASGALPKGAKQRLSRDLSADVEVNVNSEERYTEAIIPDVRLPDHGAKATLYRDRVAFQVRSSQRPGVAEQYGHADEMVKAAFTALEREAGPINIIDGQWKPADWSTRFAMFSHQVRNGVPVLTAASQAKNAWGTNFQQFMSQLEKGVSPEEAAKNTWTGRLAAELGYTDAKITYGAEGLWQYGVGVKFTRPQ